MQLRPQPVYDLTARLYARHFSRFLPGKPKIIIKHMPGAGSLRAARWLYDQSAADGALLGGVSGQALRQMIVNRELRSGRRFRAIGGRTIGDYMCAVRKLAGAGPDSRQRVWLFGATAARERSYTHARAISDTGLASIRIITGYANSVQIALALRRGEVDGFCGLSAGTLRRQLGDMIIAGNLVPLLRFAPPDSAGLPQIARASALARKNPRNAAAAQALAFLEWQSAIDFALLAPPATQDGALHVLRKGFAAMLADRKFRRDAVRWNLDVNPVSAARIENAVRRMTATSDAARPLIERWMRPLAP